MIAAEVNKKYHLALGISPMPLMVVGKQGRILLTNQHFDDLFGYAHGELVNESVEILVPDEIAGAHPELREAFFELPTNRSMGKGRDLFGQHKDGHRIPIEIGLQPIFDNKETVVLVSVVDITERKNSELRIRLTLDASSSAMIMIDDLGKIVLTNASADEMFGYAKDELLGRQVEELVPTKFRRKHGVYRTSYLNNRQRRAMTMGRDLFGLKKDKSEFPIEIGLTPIDGIDGHRVVATINDITERKARDDVIRQKNTELTHLNEELIQFAYSASHDLKAPLSSIVGAMRICQMDLEKENTQEVGVNLARAQHMAERLAQRIEDMLSLARADHITAERKPLSVADAVQETWANIIGDDHSNDISLSVKCQHEEPLNTVEPRFYAILENLLLNSWKYRDQAKKQPIVVVETRREKENFILQVRDNGIGIPADCHGKVFKLFQKFSDDGNHGSGLGLAIVHKNVRHLGGTITFESSPDGTIFTVTLPENAGLQTLEAAE